MDTPRFPDIELSVLLPAYNEEPNIERNLPRAIESLRRMVGRFEVILIDDCSRDRTGEIAGALAGRFPELRVIHNEVNLRQGGCLRKGFELARYEWVTHNAMDYPFDFEDLPALLRHLPEADVVVAARREYPGITLPRKMVSAVNRGLLRGLFGAPVRDYNFIQIYRTSVVRGVGGFSDATSFITPEKIIRAHRAGFRVVEVEVEYHRRLAGQPSSANWKNIRRALRDMAELRVELWRESLSGERGPRR